MGSGVLTGDGRCWRAGALAPPFPPPAVVPGTVARGARGWIPVGRACVQCTYLQGGAHVHARGARARRRQPWRGWGAHRTHPEEGRGAWGRPRSPSPNFPPFCSPSCPLPSPPHSESCSTEAEASGEPRALSLWLGSCTHARPRAFVTEPPVPRLPRAGFLILFLQGLVGTQRKARRKARSHPKFYTVPFSEKLY